MAIVVPFLSMCPRIRKSKGKLVARTCVLAGVLSLGLLLRRVVVDPKHKRVTVSRRLFWFFAKRVVIPFKHVESVVYSYEDWNAGTDWGWAGHTTDQFRVALKLIGGEEVHLFHFVGEGSFVNNSPFPDWMYWDQYVFDYSGDQVGASRAFAEVLKKMMGVSLTN
jgi:hypothetical protein